MADKSNPRVFISYSHDTPEHMARVLLLAQTLRGHGVVVELDQFHGVHIVNWPVWCREQMDPEQSDFVICVCTAEYRARIKGKVPPAQGKGVYWEGALLQSELYDQKGNRRFIPVLFDDEPDASIVEALRGWTFCRIRSFALEDGGYESLLRILSLQPRVIPAAVGKMPVLPSGTHPLALGVLTVSVVPVDVDPRGQLIKNQTAQKFSMDHKAPSEVKNASCAITTSSASVSIAGSSMPASERPLRLLHISDLHFTACTDPLQMLQPLIADLTDRQGLNLDKLDYLIVSGDCTCIGSAEEFERVHEFLTLLIYRLGLSAQRCVLVPGNHDLSWKGKVYEWHGADEVDTAKLPDGNFIRQGDGYLVRSAEAIYSQRFKNFSTFHHQFMQQPYPFEVEKQAQVYIHTDDKIQFIGLNSSCRIDRYFRERASIDGRALSHALMTADAQIKQAITDSRILASDDVLRIAVWHHPITGNEKIFDDAFVQRLQQADVRLCLHGHIHENRADLIGYTHPARKLHTIGAGSFGADAKDRPESIPRLYNLIEIAADRSQVRVHTRQMRRAGGAWGPNAVWPDGKGDCRDWYDIPLR